MVVPIDGLARVAGGTVAVERALTDATGVTSVYVAPATEMVDVGYDKGVLRVTLVTAPACHLCDHARAVVTRLGRTWPVALSEVPWTSPGGQQLVHRDGVPVPPALYIDGALVGYGCGVTERRLRRTLQRRSALEFARHKRIMAPATRERYAGIPQQGGERI